MRTAEEVLRTKLIFDRKEDLWVGEVLAAMEEYAQEVVKNLNIPIVKNVCEHKWDTSFVNGGCVDTCRHCGMRK